MRPTTEDIIKCALQSFGITEEQFKTVIRRSGKKSVVRPRQTAQYMCVKTASDTLQDIAVKTGVKSHATVLYSYHLIDNTVGLYPDIADYVRKLEGTMTANGFDTGRLAEKAEFKPYVEHIVRNWEGESLKYKVVPVKVTNKLTGEIIVADSMTAAARITDKHISCVWREVHGELKVQGPYKYEYDV